MFISTFKAQDNKYYYQLKNKTSDKEIIFEEDVSLEEFLTKFFKEGLGTIFDIVDMFKEGVARQALGVYKGNYLDKKSFSIPFYSLNLTFYEGADLSEVFVGGVDHHVTFNQLKEFYIDYMKKEINVNLDKHLGVAK